MMLIDNAEKSRGLTGYGPAGGARGQEGDAQSSDEEFHDWTDE